jgi:hypothetical protein
VAAVMGGIDSDALATMRVDGFNLDADETFGDGYADFDTGYAMKPLVKPTINAAGDVTAGQLDASNPNAKAFNEESMSMVMQSLDLLFPE